MSQSSLVKISEATGSIASGTSGRFRIRIIDEGEGSSGYYPAAAVEAAATDRVFPAGTHIYMDHATKLQRGPNGERSVRDLVGVLESDAVYVPEAHALDADADIFPAYREMVTEVKDHVGLSVSASAQIGPPQPGQRKPTITRIVEAESVDLVVKAGRGGQILQVIESALGGIAEASADTRREQLELVVAAAYEDREKETYAWVRDYDETARLVYFRAGERLLQQTFDIAEDDLSITLTGEPIEVQQITTYVPVTPTANPVEENKTMAEISQGRLDALLAAEKKVTALESANEELTTRAETAETERDAARNEVAESKRITDITTKVTEACKGKPAAMINRIIKQVSESKTEDIDKAITEAVEAEQTYLTAVTESRLRGFGPSTDATTEPTKHRTLWDK